MVKEATQFGAAVREAEKPVARAAAEVGHRAPLEQAEQLGPLALAQARAPPARPAPLQSLRPRPL